jgi:hypothetical protein
MDNTYSTHGKDDECRSTQSVSVKPERKRAFEKPRRKWEKWVLKEMRCEGEDLLSRETLSKYVTR